MVEPAKLVAGGVRVLIDSDLLRLTPTTCLFEGDAYGVGLSFFVVEYPPGTGARLHLHPHPEVFVVEAGEGTFTVDGEVVTATAGQIVVAPAGKPHSFRSTGSVPFRSVNVVPSGKMVFTWLEEEPT